MLTVTLPSDLEKLLADEARCRGTTPELLAIDYLRGSFGQGATVNGDGKDRPLFDSLKDYIGSADGPAEPLSENPSKHFLEGLIEKQQLSNA